VITAVLPLSSRMPHGNDSPPGLGGVERGAPLRPGASHRLRPAPGG
jgi:hypothetical protein